MSLSQASWHGYIEQLCAFAQDVGYAKTLVTLLGAILAYKVVYALYLSPLASIPGPLLARLTNKRARFYNVIGAQARKACEEYEKYGDIYVYEPWAISISNPTDIRTVLGSHAFVKADVYKAGDLLGCETTVSARDPQLASMRRRQVGPYFGHSYLAKMEKAILEHGILAIKEKWDRLIQASHSGQVEVNYHKTFLYATFDTIGSLAFGREFGSLKNDDPTVSKWLSGTMAHFAKRGLFQFLGVFPFSLLVAPFEKYYNDFVSHAALCISERREVLAKLERNSEMDAKPADLLQGYLEAIDVESKNRMSPTEVHAETMQVLITGSETSSNTLMWTLHLLMLYPECYKRAVDEVRSSFGEDHVVTYSEAKAKLPYLEACIYESMRLCPVTGGQWTRVVPSEGVSLGGHFIPGGTEVNINISGANLNKSYWDEPYLFDPTRFLKSDEAKKNVFTFSVGVRVCPGKHLAWVEMLTILANILKGYDLRLPDNYTTCGPNVLSEKGYPKPMDTAYYAFTNPVNPQRDCRVVISRRL